MWSLRKALVLTFLVVVSVPLTLFWAWPHSRAMHNEVQQVEDKHLLLARNLSTALERYSRDLVATFDYLAEDLLAGHSLSTAGPLLQSLRFRHLCVIDLDTGRILTKVSGLRDVVSDVLEPASLRALIDIANERNGLPGGVMKAPDGSPMIPLLRVSGRRMVMGQIDTAYFREIGNAISFGKNGHAVIVDHKGHALAHPNAAWERQMQDLSKISIVQRMLRKEQGVHTFYSPAFKDDMIAGFTTVPATGWGVMVPQPLSELRLTAREVNYSALYIFSIGLLLAALVALRFSLLMLKPLGSVIDGAQRMARNEPGVQIKFAGPLGADRAAHSRHELQRHGAQRHPIAGA